MKDANFIWCNRNHCKKAPKKLIEEEQEKLRLERQKLQILSE